MKFVLVVEGDTERECAPQFLKSWLDPRLNSRVAIDSVRVRGHGRFLHEIGPIARGYLNGPNRDYVIAVVGLLDLYGPSFYPASVATADDRYEWGRNHIANMFVRHDKFRMFFAVHEFEAWILGQPAALPRAVRENLPAQAARPESVDFDRPPARLLDYLYRKHLGCRYEKLKDGRSLFKKLDPDAVRDRCPRLKAMLDEMLKLAQDAGL